jgi:hypothetical protein
MDNIFEGVVIYKLEQQALCSLDKLVCEYNKVVYRLGKR